MEVVEKMVAKMCVLGMLHPRGKHLVKQKKRKKTKIHISKELESSMDLGFDVRTTGKSHPFFFMKFHVLPSTHRASFPGYFTLPSR